MEKCRGLPAIFYLIPNKRACVRRCYLERNKTSSELSSFTLVQNVSLYYLPHTFNRIEPVMYNGKVMSDKSCTFSYKSNACKFVHPADSSPQSSLSVFKDASFFSRYSRFGVPINFGLCLFRAIENNCIEQYFELLFFLCWTWIFLNGKETTPNKKELNIKKPHGLQT